MEITKDNILLFANDDEFTNFCLCPDLTFKRSDVSGVLYHDYDYTEQYNNALAENKFFVIMDKNSLVYKRGCVCKGIINKPIENVCIYDA